MAAPRLITPLHGQYSWLIEPVGQIVKVGARGEIQARFCSGFNIAENGYFLTAGHCMSDEGVCYDNGFPPSLRDTRISFEYQCMPNNDLRVCNVVTKERTHVIKRIVGQGYCNYNGSSQLDYSVLWLEPSASKYGYLSLSTKKPEVNDQVVCVQHPNGQPKQYSNGIVQAVYPQSNLIDHTAHTYPGSSGSPVVSLAGKKAVAVHVSGSVNSNKVPDQLHHYAVPTKRILTAAIAKQESWPEKVGIFSQRNNRRDSDIRIDDAGHNPRRPKPGGCC